MKLARASESKVVKMKNVVSSYLQCFIVIQLLVQNDLMISTVINLGFLNFSNFTESYSSILTLLSTFGLFACFLIPLGLISNNHVKVLFSDDIIKKAGVYYQSIMKPDSKAKSNSFIDFYMAYFLLYSFVYSIILVAFFWLPVLQLGLIIILNLVYLVLAVLRPFKSRHLNVLNIFNHCGVFISSLLMLPTLMADGYEDYPMIASLSCLIIYFVVMAMQIFNFGLLYLRLVPFFIIGIRKGFKFDTIVNYGKDDLDVDAPGVVLPNQGVVGRIQYNEPANRSNIEMKREGRVTSYNTTGIDMDNTQAMTKTKNTMMEESKSPYIDGKHNQNSQAIDSNRYDVFKHAKSRRQTYKDEAI